MVDTAPAPAPSAPDPLAGHADVPSAETPPEPSPSLAQRLMGRLFGGRRADPSDRDSDAEASDDSAGKDAPAREGPDGNDATGAPAAAPKKLEFTEEEFEQQVQRRAQAETDRRAAVRAQREEADRLRKLREEDPYQYAEEHAKQEALAQQQGSQRQFLGQVVTAYDQHTLDPIREALPAKERAALEAQIAKLDPLEGRKAFTTGALKALEQHWRADERQKLRKNPAVLKQVVLGTRDDDDEPEPVPAGAGRSNGNAPHMDDLLRGAFHRARGTSSGAGVDPFRITEDDR